MKNPLLRLLIFSLLAAVILALGERALAGPDAEELPAPTQEEIEAGLWREGKAVFSDYKLLDILMKRDYTRGYRPKQPIEYSHRAHVEKSKIECQYCHSGVAKSSFATIPSVESCMGCHATVKADSKEVAKLREYWESKKAIEWVPVHNLPEHVQFNHQRHIKAGVGCHTCHGQIQKMDVVERVSSLKMGFCVSCHRNTGASIDCGVCHY